MSLHDFPETWAFLTQSYFWLACHNNFDEKHGFCHFLKKSSFLVKFDIKNGFSDSISIPEMYTFLYISVIIRKL